MLERLVGVEQLVHREVRGVLQARYPKEVLVVLGKAYPALPDRTVVEKTGEIHVALLEVDVLIGYAPEPHAGRCAPGREVRLVVEVESHTHGRIDRDPGFVQEVLV